MALELCVSDPATALLVNSSAIGLGLRLSLHRTTAKFYGNESGAHHSPAAAGQLAALQTISG